MPLSPERLREVVVELASRPGHEKVRALLYSLLIDGLGARSTEVDFERAVPEVRGRIDALLGRTVFEFKSDLRSETGDAEEKLARYLGEREAQTGDRFVGIATDGASFVPYELWRGRLRRLPQYTTSTAAPRDVLDWLGAAVAVAADLPPTPEVVTRHLGRGSLAWQRARGELEAMWAEVGEHPDVRLKRGLWSQLLERVYGASVDTDDLFFQHTYLTVVAKTMATHVLGIAMPDPGDLLAGRAFQEAGIGGVVEGDFFDWPLAAERGPELVRRIALQAARFRLRDVRTDVLKGLYESLIDPEQRHDLGEYYTPDWLAARMCERAIDRPLDQRVLDPACGSGTFLFHAVRRLLAAADAAGIGNREALSRCTCQVLGIDVHPVAVQIARVTYLLALGEERLQDRPHLGIPVYLGDSLQWNTRGFLAQREVLIEVPEGAPVLEFPFTVARDPGLFDAVISRMLTLSEEEASAEALQAWLRRQQGLDDHAIGVLTRTYSDLRDLRSQGRNHIWGFVARNLVRPVWLSQEAERPDVIVGNPPWLAWRYMSPQMQEAFRHACQERGIWVGQVAQQQDLSAYFFARCVELYFKQTGRVGFVMPHAAMSRRQFSRFRMGVFGRRERGRVGPLTFVRFTEAWAFGEDVRPLFRVPSCVLFAELAPFGYRGTILPQTVLEASGSLPRRDAVPEEAERFLTWREAPWPTERSGRREPQASAYGERFRDGAVIFPSVLLRVQRAPLGRLGEDPEAPLVESRRTSLEKRPWRDIASLRGNVEALFLRPLYLGESIAPFRLLQPILAVIPWDEQTNQLLDSEAARRSSYLHLGRWLGEAERLWQQRGRGRRTLMQQMDYWGQLTAQLPPEPLRVVYAASGTLPAVAILRDRDAICEHKLYWAAAADELEAHYLAAVLNSESTRARVAHLQSRGQWGARDFDKVMFELPIPRFDPANRLHRRLAQAAERAKRVAAAVPLREGEYFVRARQRIREALREDGVAQQIDALVAELLRLPS
jgi:SAM-dependent methyltransferase